MTQFDGELIRAAKDQKSVHLYFSLEEILHDRPAMEVVVQVVDKYMLKVVDPRINVQFLWIQKHLLAGVRILP